MSQDLRRGKIPAAYDGDTSPAKLKGISLQLPALLLGVCLYFPEVWWMKQNDYNSDGEHNTSEYGRSARDALCDTTP
jgi:hypothetical protein